MGSIGTLYLIMTLIIIKLPHILYLGSKISMVQHLTHFLYYSFIIYFEPNIKLLIPILYSPVIILLLCMTSWWMVLRDSSPFISHVSSQCRCSDLVEQQATLKLEIIYPTRNIQRHISPELLRVVNIKPKCHRDE